MKETLAPGKKQDHDELIQGVARDEGSGICGGYTFSDENVALSLNEVHQNSFLGNCPGIDPAVLEDQPVLAPVKCPVGAIEEGLVNIQIRHRTQVHPEEKAIA